MLEVMGSLKIFWSSWAVILQTCMENPRNLLCFFFFHLTQEHFWVLKKERCSSFALTSYSSDRPVCQQVSPHTARVEGECQCYTLLRARKGTRFGSPLWWDLNRAVCWRAALPGWVASWRETASGYQKFSFVTRFLLLHIWNPLILH